MGDPLEDLAYTAVMLVRTGRPGPHRLADLDRIRGWYGLPAADRGRLLDLLVLYAAFDVDLFRHAASLADRDRWLARQVDLLAAVCRLTSV